MNFSDREKTEILYWRDSETERPESDFIGNIINKMSECGIFLNVIQGYQDHFKRAERILELGGGGWFQEKCPLDVI